MRPAVAPDPGAPRRRWVLAALSALAGLFVVVLLRTAWLCDDAYITYRTVANAVDGLGLVYNVGERVQTYTHPLWMLIHLPAHAATGEIYFTGIGISLLTTTAAMGVLCLGVARRPFAIALALVIATSSRAFVDFSSSGLENPLTHLFLALHAALLLRPPDEEPTQDRRRLLALALVAGLAATTRLDTLLLHLPGLVFQARQCRIAGRITTLTLGLSPVIAWLLFATFYYGSPLPNTAFAKLGTGTGLATPLTSALHYLENSLLGDPVTLMVALAGLALPLTLGPRRLLPLSLGIALYLLYVLLIGGDFMSGRVLTPPFFMGLAILAAAELPRSWRVRAPLLVTPAVLTLMVPPSPLMDTHGIANERQVYFHDTGLVHARLGGQNPSHPNAVAGRALRDGRQRISVQTSLGFYGYFAGPAMHLIDPFALADPLLARLPALFDPAPRPGHFQRAIPAGYLASRVRGTNELEEAGARDLYEVLRVVTQGPLFAFDRLAAIARLNTGAASSGIDRAAHRVPIGRTVSIDVLPVAIDPGSPWNTPNALAMRPGAGIRIELDTPQAFSRLELSLAARGVYVVALQRGDEIVFGRKIVDSGVGPALQHHAIDVGRRLDPGEVDAIAIYPLGGTGSEGSFSLGHLRLR